MNELAWLVEHRFESVNRREYDWVFVFDKNITLTVDCLWRLVENGRIRVTSQDEGQKFGLPSPVIPAEEINRRLAQSTVTAVELREGLLDLELHFSTGHVLQIIPDSSGYEAWHLSDGVRVFIAVGGGELMICGSKGDANS